MRASAGWMPDPKGRPELRYWDGRRWTEFVATAEAARTDSARIRQP
ncbi:MAG: DUF2510 domain-containing protein [Actinobacteria bacterium]|nr:DUF2510 domain-containing protein [Actinomycetota bacterium]